MKKIYIIDECISSAKNGIGTFLKAYVACLKSMSIDICLVVFNSEKAKFCISYINGIKYMFFPEFPCRNFLDYPQIIDKFFRLYIEDTQDNIFSINHSPCISFLKMLRHSYPLSKIIFTIHNQSWTSPFWGDYKKLHLLIKKRKNNTESNKFLLKYVNEEKNMYELVDVVICLSQSTYHTLIDIYRINQDKIYLIPNGLAKCSSQLYTLSKAELRKQYAIDEQEKLILFVGRLSKTKGIEALIQAFEYVVKDIPQVRLLIAGCTINHSCYYPINKAVTRVTWLGQLSSNALYKWYQMADIGIIPSYTEQCSYVGIEMMMHGLPVVASDGYGVSDMFQNGVNAVVAPIGRQKYPNEFSKSLADALITLLLSNKLAKQLGENAREIYNKYYTISCMKKKYRPLLDIL